MGTVSLYFFKQLPSVVEISFIVTILSTVALVCNKTSKNHQKNQNSQKIIDNQDSRKLSYNKNRKINVHYYVKFLILCTLSFSWGLLWATFTAQNIIDQRLPVALQRQAINVEGVIDNIPSNQDGIQYFEIKVNKTFPKSLWKNPGRIKLRWYDGPADLKVGQVWRLTVKLKRIRGFSNPGSFDTERIAFQNKIAAEGTVIESDEENNYKINEFDKKYCIDRLRQTIKEKIEIQLENKIFTGIITALVIGYTKNIPPAQWEVFRNTGTAHLVAISGLHVGLVAGFAFFILKWLWRFLPIDRVKIPRKIVAAVIALVTALLYALLAGFSLPTKRAVIMISLLMLSIIFKCRISVWRVFFIALGLVVINDPLSFLCMGFWLSFSAVAIILFCMRGRLNPHNLWWRWGRTQWVIFLGLTPVTLTMFESASLCSPLANLIAIPWVSFVVVPLALLGTIFNLIHEKLGGFILTLAEQCIQLLWPILIKLSLFPTLTGSVGLNLLPLVLSFFGIILWLAPRGFPGKSLSIIWLLPLLLGLFKGQDNAIEKNTAFFTLLDVGQGLATVIETQNHLLVFDTGPKLGKTDAGERVLLPFLQTRGRKFIDILMISHGDEDHAGGVKTLLKNFSVKNILTSEPHLYRTDIKGSINPRLCRAGQQWEWDGVFFQVLHPEQLNTKKRNDHSCVLRVQAGPHSLLLTGDIETKSEKLIMQRFKNYHFSSTIMLIPHHGSKTSSSLEFIQAIDPQYAIVSAGYQNAYGHPKKDIIDRYIQLGIKVFSTVQNGAISFILGDVDKVDKFNNNKNNSNNLPKITAKIPAPTPHLYRNGHQKFWYNMEN